MPSPFFLVAALLIGLSGVAVQDVLSAAAVELVDGRGRGRGYPLLNQRSRDMTWKLAVAVAVAALSLGTPTLSLGQTPTAKAKPAAKVNLSRYPAPVRATIEAETKNATLKSVSKETENGKTQYEVETLVNGKSRDLLVDPSGRVIEVEEEVALDAAPAPVQDALKAKGTVLKLESVTREGVTTYEASIKGKSGKKTEVALDAQGRPVKG